MNVKFQRAEQDAIDRTGKGWHDHVEDMMPWFNIDSNNQEAWDLLNEYYGDIIDPFEALELVAKKLH